MREQHDTVMAGERGTTGQTEGKGAVTRSLRGTNRGGERGHMYGKRVVRRVRQKKSATEKKKKREDIIGEAQTGHSSGQEHMNQQLIIQRIKLTIQRN